MNQADFLAGLEQINIRVNKEPYKHDPPEKDDWRPDADPDGKDCDSYAVAKGRAAYPWAKLIVPEWGIQNHRLACCWVHPSKRLGTYHCVEIIRTPDQSDWVLCNTQDALINVLDLERSGWVPDCIQANGGELVWKKWLGNRRIDE